MSLNAKRRFEGTHLSKVSDVRLTTGSDSTTSRLAWNRFNDAVPLPLPFPAFDDVRTFFEGDFRTFVGDTFRTFFGDGTTRTFCRGPSLMRLGLKDSSSSKLSKPSFDELDEYAYVRSRDLDWNVDEDMTRILSYKDFLRKFYTTLIFKQSDWMLKIYNQWKWFKNTVAWNLTKNLFIGLVTTRQ